MLPFEQRHSYLKLFSMLLELHGLSAKSTFLNQKKKKISLYFLFFTPLRYFHNTCTVYFKGLHP